MQWSTSDLEFLDRYLEESFGIMRKKEEDAAKKEEEDFKRLWPELLKCQHELRTILDKYKANVWQREEDGDIYLSIESVSIKL